MHSVKYQNLSDCTDGLEELARLRSDISQGAARRTGVQIAFRVHQLLSTMRSATAVVAALLLLCVSLPAHVSAIYQDQAGQYDWMQQYVGRIKLAQLVSQPRARLYVASELGAVAALSPADGKLLWRRVLAEGDAFTHMAVLGRHMITLSGGGSQLMAWDAETGAAAWTAALGGGAEGSVDLAAVGSGAVAVAAWGSIQVSIQRACVAATACSCSRCSSSAPELLRQELGHPCRLMHLTVPPAGL